MGFSSPPKAATFVLFALFAASISSTYASQANPEPFNITQPATGNNISLYVQGGEHFHWLSHGFGIDGFTVLRNSDGHFVYAKLLASGLLNATEHLVGEVDPAELGIEPNLLMDKEARLEYCQENKLRCAIALEKIEDIIHEDPAEKSRGGGRIRRMQTTPPSKGKTPAMGDIKNLVVLMRWANHLDRVVPTEEDIEILFNHEGPHELAPTGSVRDVWWTNSYNQLNLTSTVHKWVTMDKTEAYYADGASAKTSVIKEAIVEALDKLEADETFDFAGFDENGDGYIDAIAFIHSGYGAEWGGTDSDGAYYEDRIWSHKWDLESLGDWESASSGVKVSRYHISPSLWGISGSDIGRIGVVAHETGHFFGLPDLYDTDAYGQGIGSWCLMSNSWGFDQSQLYPPHLSAWCRVWLGWEKPTVITEAGSYEITAAENLEEIDGAPKIYRIDEGYPEGEYLLIENRQPLEYDQLIPQGGLAIWKIDATQGRGQGDGGTPIVPGWPQNGKQYRNSLLQADGEYQLEEGISTGDGTDLYHADGRNEISQSEDVDDGPFPNTDSYSDSPHVFQTGHRIYEIGVSGNKMTFKYQNLNDTVASPSDSSGAPIGSMVLSFASLIVTYLAL